MKTTRLAKRLGLLALALYVASVLDHGKGAGPATASQNTAVHLDVSDYSDPGNKDSVLGRAVEQTRQSLRQVLTHLRDSKLGVETVTLFLESRYDVVVQDLTHPIYKVRWCPSIMDFKLVCIESVTLLVIHPEGLVVVEVQEVTSI